MYYIHTVCDVHHALYYIKQIFHCTYTRYLYYNVHFPIKVNTPYTIHQHACWRPVGVYILLYFDAMLCYISLMVKVIFTISTVIIYEKLKQCLICYQNQDKRMTQTPLRSLHNACLMVVKVRRKSNALFLGVVFIHWD